METPLVTVGIPFYRDCDTLDYAIRSVLKQTYHNWHLILMDDGSNDGSLEIAKGYLSDSRIQLFSDGENKGLPIRLNELIELSCGKYFARMDADDIMHPERLKKQVIYLEAHPDIDVLGTGAYSISIDNQILGLKNPKPQHFTEHDLFRQTAVMHPTVMAKLSWYKHNKYSEEPFAVRAEDFELWCRSWPYTKFANLSDPLIFYREGNSIRKSLSNQILTYEHTIAIIQKYASNYLNEIEIDNLIKKIRRKRIIWKFLWACHLQSIFSRYIFQKRFSPITEVEKEYAYTILSNIINCY